MIPTQRKGVKGHSATEKARKQITTLLLDNRSCSFGSTILLGALVLALVVASYLLYSMNSQYSSYSLQLATIHAENEKLRDLLKQEAMDKERTKVESDNLQKTLSARTRQVELAQRELDDREGRILELQESCNAKQALSSPDHFAPRSDATGLLPAPQPQLQPPPQPAPILSNPFSISNPTIPTTTLPGQITSHNAKGEKLKRAIANAISLNDDAKPRREGVREAMKFAWDSYKTYAWGRDELKPVSKRYQDWLHLGLTIVDALDTLYVMGFYDEVDEGVGWIGDNLDFNKNVAISLFETNIRVLGGLLSAYEFTDNRMLLEKAEDLGNRLLKGFNSPSGLPYASVNLQSGSGASPSWTGGASILSEMGTLQLEYLYLAYHTNKPNLSEKPMNVMTHLDGLQKPIKGLYPLYVNVHNGQFTGKDVSVGALGDSFYEYLIKLYEITNLEAKGYKRMYDECAQGIIDNLVQRTSPNNLIYIAQMGRGGQLQRKQEHLTCFAGGMFAMGAQHYPKDSEEYQRHMEVAAGVTETCHEMYHRTATKIGPEHVDMTGADDFHVPGNGKHYLLRPEVVESYFYMWRYTHEQKYRDWAWEAFQAINTYCRVDGGFSGIRDVDNTQNPSYDDLQQSFLLAEAFKYLYLIFCPDDVIDLNDYVFNTEAHPFGKFPESIEDWPQQLRFQLMMF